MRIFILLLFTISLQGQMTFQRYYDTCSDAIGISVAEVDQGYFIFGESALKNNCYSFFLLDSVGNVVNSNELTLSNSGLLVKARKRAVVQENKNLLIAGSFTSLPTYDSTFWDVLIVKVSLNSLDTLWTKHFKTPELEEPISIQKSEKGYMILSEKVYPFFDSDGKSYPDTAVLHFLEIDDNGNLLQEKEVRTEHRYTLAGDFAFLENKEIAVAYDASNSYLFTEAYLGVLDSNFNFRWKKKLEEADDSDRQTLAVSKDKKSIYANTFDVERQLDGTLVGAGMVFSYDPNGRLIWERAIITNAGMDIYINGIAENDDILVCGVESESSFANRRSRITRLNKDGKIVWDWIYRSPRSLNRDESHLRQVIENKHGCALAVVFAAMRLIPGSIDYDIMVLKLDKNGCLSPDCDEIVIPTPLFSDISEEVTMESEIKIAPNPIQNSFTITFLKNKKNDSNLLISNNLGQTVFQQKLPKYQTSHQIDGLILSNGVYFYSIINEGVKIGSGKILIQK